MRWSLFRSVLAAGFLSVMFCGLPAMAQSSDSSGKLKIHVSPKQAYVFVDGKAIREGNQTLKLETGKHSVGVYNYGYTPQVQEVEIAGGTTTNLDVKLAAAGGDVSGPYGEIQLKGPERAAVLLNGTTPAYFVGHVDEFNWDWIWHQRLLVKPGTYQVTVTREGNTIWSGPVTVKADQRVTVYLNKNGEMKTADWKAGDKLGPLPRFKAGIASATVPVAPVTAQLSAQQTQLTCGQSAKLDWNSTDAVETSLSPVGEVSAHGDRTVKPMKTTTYEFIAKGPGGEMTRTVTVNVNAQPTATLSLNQPEIHFHKIGDKVVQQDSATLLWNTTNADRVTLQPFGAEGANGSRMVQADPNPGNTGSDNKEMTYTLTASNACGGSITRTATLRVSSSIEPAPAIKVASLFYPTDYPTKKHPKLGLVASEQTALADAAKQFKNHEKYDGKATLRLVAHADVRGPRKYNMALSERRAELARVFLIAHGVPADSIQIVAKGKDEQLDQKEVSKLQMADNQKPEKWMTKRSKATWLAYNRRVDLFLEPMGQASAESYPNDATDAKILWQKPKPSLKVVEMASKTPAGVQQASAASSMQ